MGTGSANSAARRVAGMVCLVLAALAVGGCGTIHTIWAESAYPHEGQFFEDDGIRIHYVTGGDKLGLPDTNGVRQPRPTLIWVHGDFGSTRDLTMSPLWPVLCAKYYVVAYERPGYGYSPRPRGRSLSSAEHAEMLHRVLERLGGDKPIVVGHSRGARIALNYACKYSREIGALVLLGLPPELPEPTLHWKRPVEYSLATVPLLGDLYVQTLVAPVGSWTGLGRRDVAEAFKPRAQGGSAQDLPPEYTRALLALALRPAEFRANELDAQRAYSNVGRFVSNIEVPVFMVHGYLDNICSWQDPAVMHCEGWMADSHMTLVGQGAHQLHWTHHGVVANVIDEAVEAAGHPPDQAAVNAARARTAGLAREPRTFVRVRRMAYVDFADVMQMPKPPWTGGKPGPTSAPSTQPLIPPIPAPQLR